MLYFKDKILQFNKDKCCACTVCLGVCEEDALSYRFANYGIEIKIEQNKCTKCGVCVRICPVRNFSKGIMNGYEFNYANGCELTHTKDSDLRFRSSSGGTTRMIAYKALESGLVDLVYTLNSSNDSPTGIYYNKNNLDKVLKTVNSQYRPVLFGMGLRTNLADRKILVIGTPCQVKAVQDYYRIRKMNNTLLKFRTYF